MTDITIAGVSSGSRGRAAGAFVTFAALAALLCLDGRLGPLSFLLRRDVALAVLAVVVVSALGRRGPGDGAARSGGAGRPVRRVGWRIAGWAAVVAAVAIVARAPSVPVALLGFVIALAAIEIGTGAGAGAGAVGDGWIPGPVPACLSYVVLRVAVDLVPRAGTIAEATARAGSWWINRARGFDLPLSFTAIGGPAVGLALLYLLWNGRASRMGWRIVAAVVIAAGWFALLPAVTPEVAAGPIAVFSRGAGYGLFWLATAAVVGVVLGRRLGGDPSEEGGGHPAPP